MIQNRALRLAWPEGVTALVGLALVAIPSLHAVARPFLRVLPPLVLVAGLIVGWRFGRGRLLFAVLVLATANLLLDWFAAPPPGAAVASAGRLLVAVLLPLNLAALSFVPETPPLGRYGRQWALAFAVQLAIVTIACAVAPRAIAVVLSPPLFPFEARWLTLPHLALVVFLATAALHAFHALAAPHATVRGLLWSTMAALVAMNADRPEDRTLFLAVGGLVLVVSMLEASYSLAFNDELTGLPGRRAFNQALAGLSSPYVIAMVDVDHFKRFNDEHGHDVGDQVLRMVAGRLGHVGEHGLGYRYGGEEFAVVFPGASIGMVRPDLEALRVVIETATFTFRGTDRPQELVEQTPKRGRSTRRRDLNVTVSIGAAEGGESPAATVEAADKALYKAKGAGRNRVEAIA